MFQFSFNLFNSMCAFAFILTVDPNLGHVDHSSLSDQTLMEMLIEGCPERTRKIYQDKSGNYLDVCEWECVACDAAKNVVELENFYNFNAPLHLSYIPSKVRLFKAPHNRVKGSIDFAHLPEKMSELLLQDNEITGTIDLTRLPKAMWKLSVNDNQLTGSVDLTQLPEGMMHLQLRGNQFAGTFDVTKLPQSMLELHLGNNFFTGSFIATSLPPNLLSIVASGNEFSATAVVDSQTSAQIHLQSTGVTSAVDENGDPKTLGVWLSIQ